MKKILSIISLLFLIPLTSCGSSRKDLVILYTNDSHGAFSVDSTLSFKNVAKLKKDYSKDNNVLLFDSGDIISGGVYVSYDKGDSVLNMLSKIGYNAATFGNHEFNYGPTYLKEIYSKYNFPFICSNFYNVKDGKATTRFTESSSKLFKFDGISIGVIGVTTPDTMNKTTPTFYKDKDGNYIYTFSANNLYEVVQKDIDSIRNSCDYLICLAHLGDSDTSEFTSSKLAANTSGIDFIFDGHTHDHVKGKQVKDKNNKNVLITQAGGKFTTIGKLTITKNNEIKNEFVESMDESDDEIKQMEKNIIDDFDKKFSKQVAKSDIEFIRSKAKETNLGDLDAESSYYYYNEIDKKSKLADFSVVNTGGIRSKKVSPGTWTLKTCNEVNAFSNSMCLKEFKGDVIKKAFEFATRKMPDDFGGLLQVCGIKMDVNTSIVTDIVEDSYANYVSGPSKEHERVSNIQVYDKNLNAYVPFDESKSYVVSGPAFTLEECGDGLSMFKNGTLLDLNYEYCDYKMLESYVSRFDVDNDLPKIEPSRSPLKKYSNLGIDYTSEGYSKRINLINS